MSGIDDQIDDTRTFDLSDFIGEQSELFVTMGVFGALALYISQSTAGDTPNIELMIKTGFVSAFGLSLLMFGLIYSKLINEFGGWNSLYLAHFRLRNIPLTVFSLFSMVLVISLSFILTQHEPVIFLLILIGTFVTALGIIIRLIYGVVLRVPRTPAWRISTMFLTSLVTLLITLYLRTRILTQFEVTAIQNLSYSNPVPVVITVSKVLVASIESLAGIAVLASIIAIPLVMFDKIRGKSSYDKTE